MILLSFDDKIPYAATPNLTKGAYSLGSGGRSLVWLLRWLGGCMAMQFWVMTNIFKRNKRNKSSITWKQTFAKNMPTANDTQTKQTSNVADHDVDTNF